MADIVGLPVVWPPPEKPQTKKQSQRRYRQTRELKRGHLARVEFSAGIVLTQCGNLPTATQSPARRTAPAGAAPRLKLAENRLKIGEKLQVDAFTLPGYQIRIRYIMEYIYP